MCSGTDQGRLVTTRNVDHFTDTTRESLDNKITPRKESHRILCGNQLLVGRFGRGLRLLRISQLSLEVVLHLPEHAEDGAWEGENILPMLLVARRRASLRCGAFRFEGGARGRASRRLYRIVYGNWLREKTEARAARDSQGLALVVAGQQETRDLANFFAHGRKKRTHGDPCTLPWGHARM